MNLKFKSKIWLYSSEESSWHFISLPKKLSKDIKGTFAEFTKGFGSLKVNAKIGKTSWHSSIFPDKKRACYLLPVKVDVRKKEKLEAGDKVEVKLSLEGF